MGIAGVPFRGELFILLAVFSILFQPVAGNRGGESEASEGMVEINGAAHYYQVMGEGEPLVILHGGPGLSHHYFLPHFKALTDEYQLIFYDQRASGNSSRAVPPETISTESFVDDLEGIRKSFKLEKMSLLGHSWGGLLALRYALEYPERTERLILVDSAPPNAELDAVNFQAREERRSEDDVRKIREIMASEAFRKLEAPAVRNYFQISEKVKFHDPAMIKKMEIDLDRDKIEKLVWVGQLMNPHLADYDIVDQLSSITCPVLVIHGDYDTIPLESSRLIYRQIKGSRLLVLEDCGHFPFIEAPVLFFREVRDFLEETGKP